MDRQRLVGELELLYRDRYRQFLRVAIAIVGEKDAHDVVQETFARAIRSAGSYRGEGTVEAWVWRVLVNAALAARAQQQDVLLDPASVGPDNGLSTVEDDGDVRVWVALLPERQRLAVFLRYYADLDYRSIASALGIELGTVSATLSAAHTALRGSLREVS